MSKTKRKVYKNICKCNTKGIEVGFDTVFNLCNNYMRNVLDDGKYYLCINKECDIAYYTDNELYISATQVNKPIWFKNNKGRFIICYCRDITLEDVRFAVSNLKNDIDINNVVKFLEKENIELSCIRNNPTGNTCDKLFLSAIEYSKKNRYY